MKIRETVIIDLTKQGVYYRQSRLDAIAQHNAKAQRRADRLIKAGYEVDCTDVIHYVETDVLITQFVHRAPMDGIKAGRL